MQRVGMCRIDRDQTLKQLRCGVQVAGLVRPLTFLEPDFAILLYRNGIHVEGVVIVSVVEGKRTARLGSWPPFVRAEGVYEIAEAGRRCCSARANGCVSICVRWDDGHAIFNANRNKAKHEVP
jgi:hypothetical protein